MAAVQCDNFVGNAWKKDLCLNCFKSKEEHVARNGYLQSIIQTRIPDPPKEGILKGPKSRNSSLKGNNKVIFHNMEFEVIGFGGDDSYSDDDYPDFACNQVESEDVEDTEEDRAFQKLTKSNTDYNSIPENLQEPKEGEVKKLIEPLKLGKQVFDDKGKKKTLLVSVTPFGDQISVKNKVNANGVNRNLSSGTEAKLNGCSYTNDSDTANKLESSVRGFIDKTEKPNGSGPVPVQEIPAKTNGVHSGTDEKMRKSENSVEITQLKGDDSSGKVSNDKSIIKRSQPLDKNHKFRLIKDFQKENDSAEKDEIQSKSDRIKTSDKVNNLLDKARKKVNQFPVITDNSNFKFKAKDFTNSGLKKSAENNKGVVLDMYKIREKEDVKAINEINEEKTIKGRLTSSEIRAKFLMVDLKGSTERQTDPTTDRDPERNSSGMPVPGIVKEVQEKFHKTTALDRTKLVPNVSSLYRHHVQNTTLKKEEKNQVEVIAPIVKPLMNGVVSSMTLVPSIECVFKECKTNGEVECEPKHVKSEEEAEGTVLDDSCTVESEEEPATEIKFKKISVGTIENFDNIIKGEEIILFSADKGLGLSKCEDQNEDGEELQDNEVGSESAENSDDQKSSDDSSVPPALPTKPPPSLLESRTTFLHDLTTVEGCGTKGIQEKPKVPAKPIIIHSKRTNFQSPVHMVSTLCLILAWVVPENC
ncbi:hypothetical protein RUM44_000904 [Polyplax serrata]|uniref:Uncharacterized protein n=1 Tax=Polyplax serrata TaxID=468196 RepID=A0ABR1B6D2_POLSC